MSGNNDFLSRLGVVSPQNGDAESGEGEFQNKVREPLEIEDVKSNVPDTPGSDLKQDYVKSRNLLHTLMNLTTQSANTALQVATETEHPRAFEAFNSLATTARTLAKDLIDLQKLDPLFDRYRALAEPVKEAGDGEGETPTVKKTGKISTADLLEIMEQSENGSESNKT